MLRIFTAPADRASVREAGRRARSSTSHARRAAPVWTSWATPCVVSWPCQLSGLRASRSLGFGGVGVARASSVEDASSVRRSDPHCSRVSLGRGLMLVRSPWRDSTCTRARRMPGRSEGGAAGEKVTAPPPIEVGADRASVPAGDPNAIADARDAPPAPAAASAEDNRAAARMSARLDAFSRVAQDPSAAARRANAAPRRVAERRPPPLKKALAAARPTQRVERQSDSNPSTAHAGVFSILVRARRSHDPKNLPSSISRREARRLGPPRTHLRAARGARARCRTTARSRRG